MFTYIIMLMKLNNLTSAENFILTVFSDFLGVRNKDQQIVSIS